ncbi:MAG: DUF362 domain-containing protein [Candidatus Thorarchaeota archaeon]|jgi:uncharacterized protein (DUF362 family)
MTHKAEQVCTHERNRKRPLLKKLGIIAIVSAIWYAFRTGMKPSRAMYPCQRAALLNVQMFKTMATVSVPFIAGLHSTVKSAKPFLVLTVVLVSSIGMTASPFIYDSQSLDFNQIDYARIPISLTNHSANTSADVSDLFFVQNASRPEGDLSEAVSSLIDLMAAEGQHFFDTANSADGLIGSNDVIIIKMNGQWSNRGGTNTDLIRSVIKAIISHPEDFTGEIIVADNGQGWGDLDRQWSNAYYRNQSAQDVVDSFVPAHSVSTVLWDLLRESTVADYDEGDFRDGYVRSSTWDDATQMYVSYPKFQSPMTGAHISFRNGVWSNDTGFDSDRLKILNIPVLKTHQRLAVTACVKNYMGVPQGYVIPEVDEWIPHEHFSIPLGGMGTLMAETRVPTLNILDMIWINANPIESSPNRGPWSFYMTASFTDIIGASVDAVALDYWSAKYVLLATAQHLGYENYSSLDPDFEPTVEHSNVWGYPYPEFFPQEESLHNYLGRSMNILKDAGFQATMDPAEMNVFVTILDDRPNVTIATTTTTTTENLGSLDKLDPLPMMLLTISAGLLVLATIVVLRRRSCK